jgi:4-hydroxybenzoate polyprenyltransferase
MGRAAALVRCSHPLPTAAVVTFTVVVALSAGAGAKAALAGAAVLAGQLGIGWGNDFADRHRDRAAGRGDKPLARGELPDGWVATAAGLAVVLCVALSFAAGAVAGVVHVVAVTAGWTYNLGLKATVLSPLPYAVHFALVPPWFVAAGLPGHPAPRPALVAASAVLGVSAHFANTLGDERADRLTGVRGLPQRLGPAAAARVSALLLLGAGGLLLGLPRTSRPLAGAAVAGALLYAVRVCGSRPLRDRRAFALNLAVVGLLLGSFVAAGGQLAPAA